MNEKYKQNFLKAGSIARDVRAFGKGLIVKGASYNSVIDQINKKIVEFGGKPAFPPQIALNYVAAHYLPQPDEDIVFSDQVIKLDVGICYNGAIGDCAVTIDLSGKYQKLIDATEAALLAAEKTVKVGVKFSEIGRVIEDTVASYGFKSVKNLAGHGLGYYKIHTAPQVPNYFDKSSHDLIKPDMTFAIEPFATDGKGFIHEQGMPAIFSYVRTKSVKLEAAKFILNKIKSLNGLPFAIHHFMGDKYSLQNINDGIHELLKSGIIAGYAPLVEDEQFMVAQAENSVLVDKDGTVTITTR